jgi:hypothetical protein
VARVLIVGEAADLEAALGSRGYSVRTTPEPVTLGPLMAELEGVSAICWLGGPDLLEPLAAKLVDTHVRGFACRESGASVARRFAETFAMPTAVIEDGDWPAAGVRAVESVLS